MEVAAAKVANIQCYILYILKTINSLQFSPLTHWIVEADMRNDSAEILFQSFLQEAFVSSSGMARDVTL